MRRRNKSSKLTGATILMDSVPVRTNRNLSQVGRSFRSQRIMKRLGAHITRLERGLVEISAQNDPGLSQQDGFVHAGVLATLLDTAGGYAVLSMLPRGSRVLAVEFKINFTKPAIGDMIRATGKVRKVGRRLAICELEAKMREKGRWISCAWGSQTVYCIRPDASHD
jgi:uncharacterized protein (TIGR00369 family)